MLTYGRKALSLDRSAGQLAHVSQPACDRGRGRHRRADEMRAGVAALASLEVAVRGRGTALAWRNAVRVHAEAHGTAGLAPLKTRCDEDPVQPLGFGLLFDER